MPSILFLMKVNLILLVFFVSLFYSCGNHKSEIKTDAPKPSGNCTYSRDEKDPLGKRIRLLDEEKFISQAFDSSERNAINGDEYFKGYLSCVSVDTVLGVYFRFIVHSDNAFQEYGMIKKENKITFIFKSGKAVELSFGSTFSGNTDLSKNITEFSTFAYLPQNASRQLLAEELARVRISWTKAEEDYTVVNPNIFINQVPCLQ